MKKMDATWENVEKLMIKIKANCSDAGEYANDAVSSAENAYKYLADLQELLKIRKEYEGQSVSIEDYLKNMEASVGNLNHNLKQIRKETSDESFVK